jgi:hypothetical protein
MMDSQEDILGERSFRPLIQKYGFTSIVPLVSYAQQERAMRF